MFVDDDQVHEDDVDDDSLTLCENPFCLFSRLNRFHQCSKHRLLALPSALQSVPQTVQFVVAIFRHLRRTFPVLLLNQCIANRSVLGCAITLVLWNVVQTHSQAWLEILHRTQLLYRVPPIAILSVTITALHSVARENIKYQSVFRSKKISYLLHRP